MWQDAKALTIADSCDLDAGKEATVVLSSSANDTGSVAIS